MKNAKCKICRRLGVKLFLRGERCLSPKCSMVKKAYPPGIKRKRRIRSVSEYGKELNEKQRLKNWYNLKERQFRKYVKEVLGKRLRSSRRSPIKSEPIGKVEDAAALLIKRLESRLDNVVFRLGFANSRAQAKQLVSHGHFLINGKSIDVPSYQVRNGDTITLKPQKIEKKRVPAERVQNLKNLLKKYKTPHWLELNVEKLEGKVTGEPTLEEAAPPVEISAIFEYYSR